MQYTISPISNEDREAIIDIFNHYIENSFAAYPENKVSYQAFDMLLHMANGLPSGSIKDREGRIVGFGMLRPHNPVPTFSHTAEWTCFIEQDHTGRGLGEMLLRFLEKGAAEKGIRNILANISSLNPGSIRFHQRHGFIECGRFKRVGKKNGREFDTVWMQKRIGE
jgi:phosphinothricin acetyltransferase